MLTMYQAKGKNQIKSNLDPYNSFFREILEAGRVQGAQITLRALAIVQLVEYQIGF